ncbi:GNAT family N-acetyltransferase [Streptosporangium sp. NPDC000396]|uniref:GNAT family N-acetyltransferase n=1 Tax=Streptosporangium sp. NPDC000396 TaxID=3366185 RepID=UPI003696C42A
MDQQMHPLPGLVRRWQAGWGRCRGLDPAKEARGALHVTLGLPNRHREIIALHADDDAESLRGLVAEVSEASKPTWLTVPTRNPEAIEVTLRKAGLELVAAPERLMTVDLRSRPSRTPPEPYTAETTVTGSVAEAHVKLPAGEAVARGVMAVVNRDAVAHAIETVPAHRRRGLAGVIMSSLCEWAVVCGAVTGLLIASPEGERLYSSLGWTSQAAILTARMPVPV